jgi:hypothetical protein
MARNQKPHFPCKGTGLFFACYPSPFFNRLSAFTVKKAGKTLVLDLRPISTVIKFRENPANSLLAGVMKLSEHREEQPNKPSATMDKNKVSPGFYISPGFTWPLLPQPIHLGRPT